MTEYILTIDPGATNTKGVLREYKRGGQINPDIAQRYEAPSDTKEMNGILCETAPDAMFKILDQIPDNIRKNIKAISITSHGASHIPINAQGEAIFGAVFYNQELFNKYHDLFFQRFGSSEDLYQETGSAEYPIGINAAQQIFYHMMANPRKWAETTDLLPLSHYMAFLLTGKRFTCHTHTRNHAYFERIMPNDQGFQWSSVVTKMGINDLFPGFKRAFDPNGYVKEGVRSKYNLPEDCIIVAAGHDTSDASILAPNYINTGTWICNTAAGVPIDLVPAMQQKSIVANADIYGKNLRTIMAKVGQSRDAFRSQYITKFLDGDAKSLPQEVKFKNLKTWQKAIPLAFMEGVGVYPSLMQAELDIYFNGKVDEFIHALSFSIAVPEALSSIFTSDASLSLDSTLSRLFENGYRAKPVVIGGKYVEDLKDGSMGTFTETFRRVYPGGVERFTFPEPTSYAAHILAVCALEGIDPRNLEDRVNAPTQDITFRGDKRLVRERIELWEGFNSEAVKRGQK